jgi:ferric iron reductase protein FhuF
MQTFYRQTINPLLETASESAGIKPEVLWSQYGGRMRYVVDLLLEQNYPDEVNQRIRQDYDWLCGLDPAVFNLRKNPFVIRPKYVDNPWNPDKPLLLRSACCLYDQREQGEKCYSCPKLTPREREAMKEQIIKEIAAAR